ncbi:hypothetical protein [Nocardia salmonicida]|uniref:hypothetical protein n=1 Tax=Nocardia salmonicida TaxID=53431 RepID=UPI0007A4E312|nr:hypothetical protein [Nocardia salmonicida]
MAICALVLYLVFGLLGFGWRSWRQYQATGSTGFHGIGGRPGSLEWLAGVGFVAAIVVGTASSLLQLAGVVAPIGALSAIPIQAGGFVIQVRAVEEPYLTRVHGAHYRAYLATTGRFVPGFGQAPL